MSEFTFKDRVYPNGEAYQQVSLNGVDLGHLVKTEAGFKAPGWSKQMDNKDDALAKMRTAAIVDRKRKISALQADINKLAAA